MYISPRPVSVHLCHARANVQIMVEEMTGAMVVPTGGGGGPGAGSYDQVFTLYTPFITICTPVYSRYTCIYAIYTPYIHHIYT